MTMMTSRSHSAEIHDDASDAPSMSEIISALSFALDLTEGAVPGHALRCCLFSMRIGTEMGLSAAARGDLYNASLIKDVGCSSNSARMCQIIGGGDDRALKAGVKLEDWTRPHQPKLSTLRLLWETVSPGANAAKKIAHIFRIGATQHSNNREMITLRCDRGASIVRKIGMGEQAAMAVRSLDEHWDGSGYPERLQGFAIPMLARIMAVSQHLDVFARDKGVEQALAVLRERSGRWFDPEIVRVVESLHRSGTLWGDCLPGSSRESTLLERRTRSAVLEWSPNQTAAVAPAHVDRICDAFSEVVDAKSPFTFRHSIGVTEAAGTIGSAMGLEPHRLQMLHRAALLHDLGKLRVPNSILDKPGKLDTAEWKVMQEHSGLTRTILERIPQYREMAKIAGAHHEKLDGTGYPNRLHASELPLEARILAVADVYGALTEDRPYRSGFSVEEALKMMHRDVPAKLDKDCFDALTGAVRRTPVTEKVSATPAVKLAIEPGVFAPAAGAETPGLAARF